MMVFPLLASGFFTKVLAVLFVVCAVSLILLILVQKGKGGGLSSAFGGGAGGAGGGGGGDEGGSTGSGGKVVDSGNVTPFGRIEMRHDGFHGALLNFDLNSRLSYNILVYSWRYRQPSPKCTNTPPAKAAIPWR